MFGKLMRISDELMWRYYELLSREPMEKIASRRREAERGANPMESKFDLASEIVGRFHSTGAAEAAKQAFIARFRDKELPEDMPEYTLMAPVEGVGLAALLRQTGLAKSTSEALRLITQGGVRIDRQKVANPDLQLKPGTNHVFQVGKRRFARVKVVSEA
jgi:tyrosyl-tRNA synthetase